MAADYELVPLDKIKDSKLSVQAPEITVNPEAQFSLEPEKAKPFEFSTREMIGNIPSSGIQLGRNIGQAVTSPRETLSGLGGTLGGLLYQGLPEGVGNPETRARQTEMYNNAKQYLGERFGGQENLLKTLQNDPVGLAADLSAVLTGGGSALLKAQSAIGRTGGLVGNVGKYAKTAGEYTNPITGVQYVAKESLPTIMAGVTRTSPESFITGYEAGKEGGNALKSFRGAMTGKIPESDIVFNVKKGINIMGDNASNVYNTLKTGWANTGQKLNYDNILNGLDEVKTQFKVGGQTNAPSKLLKLEQQKLGELDSIVSEFKNPKYHTAEGFDFMKQKIGKAMPSAEYSKEVRSAYTKVLDDVRNELSTVKGYDAAMTNYGKTMSAINDIKQSLTSGQNVEGGIRKVLSLVKDAPTQEYRLSIADTLKNATGIDIMPAVAGSSLKDLTSPYFKNTMLGGGAATGIASFINPAYTLPALGGLVGAGIVTSPRLLGELSQLSGQVAKYLPAERVRNLGLLGETATQTVRNPQKGLINLQQPLNPEDYGYIQQ
jgi:hypothetical protein